MLASIMVAATLAVLPAPVRGDFDHDGKPDLAEVVRGPHGTYKLVIQRGAVGHPTEVLLTFPASELSGFFISKGKPGRWRTWCGKGGGSDDDPCPRKSVLLRGDTLTFGTEGASESVALWNGKRFKLVLLSD